MDKKINYIKRYYHYQTQARGLLNKQSLLRSFKKTNKWYSARLRKYLPIKKDAKCLDVPCGYGNFLFFLKSEGYTNIQGFDLDSQQVSLSRLLNLPVKVKDAFKVISNEKNSYDLISSLDFIEHLTKDEALMFLDGCYLSLRKGGVLILRTPCADGFFGAHDACNDLTHHWCMSSNLLKTILKMCGFSKVKILDERPQPTSILGTLRWLLFFPSKAVFELFCLALGIRPPKILSRSMIAIALKK